MKKSCVKSVILFFSACLLASCATGGYRELVSGHAPSRGSSISSGLARTNLYHTLAPGETLWRVSKMYDVDIEVLKKVNNIKRVSDVEVGTRIFIPRAVPRREVISFYPNDKWKYIIVHHSATDSGDSYEFHKIHKRKGWDSVGYHFVIDNGTCGKEDGQIESTPRWINQLSGAHCKASGMNEKGIGVCLVGNFSISNSVTPRQMRSLVYLVKRLMAFYKIPPTRVLGHRQVPEAKTECPGTRFPWPEFKSRLSSVKN